MNVYILISEVAFEFDEVESVSTDLEYIFSEAKKKMEHSDRNWTIEVWDLEKSRQLDVLSMEHGVWTGLKLTKH